LAKASAKAVNLNFLSNCACTAFNYGVLSATKKKLRISPLPFLTYLCNRRLRPSIHWVQV